MVKEPKVEAHARAVAKAERHIAHTLYERDAINSARRRAYRERHPKKESQALLKHQLQEAEDEGDEAQAADLKECIKKREPRDLQRLFTFESYAGLKEDIHQENILDLADYFETGIDRLDRLYLLKSFQYCFYRVSAQGNYIRGYIRFRKPVSDSTLAAVIGWLKFDKRNVKQRDELDLWVAGDLPGKFYSAGVKPKHF